MRRNIAGLKRSAQLRSEQAMDRALAALHRMETTDRFEQRKAYFRSSVGASRESSQDGL
jgi:hypothetical protein